MHRSSTIPHRNLDIQRVPTPVAHVNTRVRSVSRVPQTCLDRVRQSRGGLEGGPEKGISRKETHQRRSPPPNIS